MKIFSFFIISFLPFIIIISNFLFLVFRTDFYLQIYKNTSVYSELNKDQREEIVNNIVGYFMGKNNLEQQYFSNQAISHMRDVKKLIIEAEVMDVITTTGVLLCLIFLIIKKKFNLIKIGFMLGSLLTLSICLVLLILTKIDFLEYFTLFHKIAFTNDLWQFNDSDNLIKLFPTEFFFLFTKTLFINIIASSLLIFTISQIRIKK